MDLREKEKERVNLAHLHAPASLTTGTYKSAVSFLLPIITWDDSKRREHLNKDDRKSMMISIYLSVMIDVLVR